MAKHDSMWLSATIFAGLVLLPLCGALHAADSDTAEFRAVKGAIQKQLHNKKPDERIAALVRLEAFPNPEAAKMVLQVATKDESDEVREAAYKTVGTLAENEQVSKLLFDILQRDLRRKEPAESSVPLLAALLGAKSEQVFADSAALLDKQSETVLGARLIGVELADRLGERGRTEDVALLERLSTTDIFKHRFGLRRAVVTALAKADSRPAIGALITLLGRVDGEAQAVAIKYLTTVTGQVFGDNQEAWSNWWAANSQSFVIPPLDKRTLPALADISPGITTYYGLPVYATRVVFVIDCSNSMIGPRLAAAKRELVTSLEGLPANTEFTVLAFASTTNAWQHKLVVADKANKQAAIQFVKKQATAYGTASFDVLEAAMAYDAEAIFFLTDGAPYGGKIVNPVEIVRVISLMNRSERKSIYTIGIGAGMVGSPMDNFLRTLADANLGIYRRVDE